MNIFIVDMIKGFATKGTLSSPRVADLIPSQVAFLERVPQDSNIVFVYDCHKPGDSEFKRMPVHCEQYTEETDICPELLEVCKRRGLHYISIPKQTHSAFYKTNLEDRPEFASVGDGWVMFGCVTDVCILANLIEMDYRGKNVTLLRDLIDTYDIPGHDPDVYNKLFFDSYFPDVWGATICNSEDIG